MKNRYVGFLIIGIALVIIAIILIFNAGLKSIIAETCTHGDTCPMFDTVSIQTGISLAIAGLLFLFGVFFLFLKDSDTSLSGNSKSVGVVSLKGLLPDEKKLVTVLSDNDGTLFQSDLVDKSGFDKVKVTRILDKLEGKGFIERKRRGMSNVVILKR